MSDSHTIQASPASDPASDEASLRGSAVSNSACADLGQLLPFFVNGSLGPREHRSVRGHLIRCAGCRAEARRLEGLMESLALQRVPAADTAARVVRVDFPHRAAQTVAPARPAHRFRPGLLAAALIGAFALGSLLAPLSHMQDFSVPDQIAAEKTTETPQPSTFDNGFESGDLQGWTLSNSVDGTSGSSDESQTSKGDPS